MEDGQPAACRDRRATGTPFRCCPAEMLLIAAHGNGSVERRCKAKIGPAMSDHRPEAGSRPPVKTELTSARLSGPGGRRDDKRVNDAKAKQPKSLVQVAKAFPDGTVRRVPQSGGTGARPGPSPDLRLASRTGIARARRF